jgi:hypothetical protein
MDPSVRAAMEKWPQVPDLFGWLSLDARGRWRLQGEALEHHGLVDFIGRNYQADPQGRWHFQNGPQRVFVTLACTPWIARLAPDGALHSHTGQALRARACLVDDAGQLIFDTDQGPALLDDRDLLAAAGRIVRPDGTPTEADALVDPAADLDPVRIQLADQRLPLARVRRAELPARFDFEPDPQPDPAS